MNPIAAGVLVVIGLVSLLLSVKVGVDQVRCYRRGDSLSATFGIALMLGGLIVAVSCFVALRMVV